jgi:hypothetical protein
VAEVDHHHAVLGCLLNSLKAFIELPVAKLVVAAVMEPTVGRPVQCRARRAAALALRIDGARQVFAELLLQETMIPPA